VSRRTPVLAALVAAFVLLAACSSAGGGGDDASPTVHVTGATASPQKLGGPAPLTDVNVYSGLSRNHIEGEIRYRQTPPVGGDHSPIPATCGAYDDPIPSANAVHSMEHGAVWITFRPSLPDSERQALRNLVPGNPYLLVSPWEDDELPSPIVLSAWGLQLGVQKASDPAVAAFVHNFAQGPQTPEPGAACAGVGSPAVTANG
jgi:hypothetical protein